MQIIWDTLLHVDIAYNQAINFINVFEGIRSDEIVSAAVVAPFSFASEDKGGAAWAAGRLLFAATQCAESNIIADCSGQSQDRVADAGAPTPRQLRFNAQGEHDGKAPPQPRNRPHSQCHFLLSRNEEGHAQAQFIVEERSLSTQQLQNLITAPLTKQILLEVNPCDHLIYTINILFNTTTISVVSNTHVYNLLYFLSRKTNVITVNNKKWKQTFQKQLK